MNKRTEGTKKETLAVEYLQAQGVTILERNYRCKRGEIDIIGRDGEYLVFFEVKYRRTSQYGFAQEAVTLQKQKTICLVSDYYRMVKHLPALGYYRYDVIAINGEDLQWFKNAFPYWQRYR